MTHHKEIQEPVAIIGIGCLFPKASGLTDYWRLLSRGQDAISDVPETHWRAADYHDPDPRTPDHVYCTRGGYLTPVDFDPSEFGIPPNLLEATDTSQLLGLVAAKAALADAGYDETRDFERERVSVILGVTGTQELVIPLGARLGHPIWRRALEAAGVPEAQREEVIARISDAYVPWQESSFPGLLGNVVAGRISNRLNLGGTNCVVDAACASSMGAMHLALMELKTRRADMVVTGGVDTINDIFMHMCFSKTPILSPTGDVRPFSDKADGSLLGEGIGILVFKRLADAEAAGDRIYAVIKSMGSASDGRSSSIYAPRPEGQMKALRMAYEAAGVSPASIGLIEAHGTGTRVGDEVEFQALTGVFSQAREAEPGSPADGQKWCALGTVKSMIGHTKAAAGAAGLIKAALSLYNRVLPPTLKVAAPDPRLDLAASPFYLNTDARPWLADDGTPRRAGVSSFGFGGSNFHLVLEEYPRKEREVAWDGSVEIMALSGRTREELADHLSRLKGDVDRGLSDAEVARRAAESRVHFSPNAPHRLLMVIEKTLDRFEGLSATLADAMDALRSNLQETLFQMRNIFYSSLEMPGQLAFVFPGQGSQYVGMGRDLFCRFPVAQETLNRANRRVDDRRTLGELIFPMPAFTPEAREEQARDLTATDAAQPAIGAVSAAMERVLRYFGVRPDVTCGHSFGELVALFSAGWIDAATFFELAFVRGSLMKAAGEAAAGAMLAVKAPLEQIDGLIAEEALDLVLANRNAPNQGVLSGAAAEIDKAESACRRRGISCRRLPVSAAFHTSLMAEAADAFSDVIRRSAINPTDTPVFSNVTGEAYPTDPDAARKLLSQHLLSPVDFVREIRTLVDLGVRTFVEVGPKSVLTGLVKSILGGINAQVLAMDSASGKRFGIVDLARLICCMAALGHGVELKRWERGPEGKLRTPRMRIPLAGANHRNPKKSRPGETRRASAPPAAGPERPSQPAAADGSCRPAPPSDGTGPCGNRPEPLPVPERQHTTRAVPTDAEAAPALTQSAIPAPAPGREPPTTGNMTTMTNHHPKEDNPLSAPPSRRGQPAGPLSQVFNVVQEGLRSMQALQLQTAEAHKQFLETQSQASRTLQEMMGHTQRLMEAGLTRSAADGSHSEMMPEPQVPAAARMLPPSGTAAPRPEKPEPVPPAAPAKTQASPRPQAPPAPAAMPQAPLKQRAAQAPQPASTVPATPHVQPDPGMQVPKPSKNGRGKIEKILVGVVGELTGYPTDMIALDMDLEADLGIDSIKRVEILSSFEEKMPDMPGVSPEEMAELKTLGQIVDHLVGAKPSRPADPPAAPAPSLPPEPAAGPVEAVRADTGAIAQTLIGVVGELTGYPEEMIDLNMEIEADLGIDSIKRVEILSTFEERMPDIPPISPEEMGTLRTLGQIVDFLTRETAGPAGRGTAREPARESDPAAEMGVERSAGAPAASDSAAVSAPGPGDAAEIRGVLVAVVGELTGYPEEMIDLDMEIEADLGIDSIKRVEILSAFEERMPHLPAVSPEEMGRLSTLGDILRYLSADAGARIDEAPQSPAAGAAVAPVPVEAAPAEGHADAATPAALCPKRVVRMRERPFAARRQVALPEGRSVLISEDESGLGTAIAELLERRGIKAVLAAPGEISDWAELYPPAGLILLSDAWAADPEGLPGQAFQIARAVGPELIASGRRKGAVFATITRLDGAMGFSGTAIASPVTGALAGLAKTAAVEWPEVTCHALDLDPQWRDSGEMAEAVVREIFQEGGMEIALSPSARRVPDLVDAFYGEGDLALSPGDLVVVSGGARGVTAAAVTALCQHLPLTFLLLGRSPEPEPEPAWLAGVSGEPEMKRAILARLFPEGKAAPAQLEQRYRGFAAAREMRETFAAIEAGGGRAVYRAVDVRDARAVAEAVQEVRAVYGPVRAVIHGAGTLADRAILEKTPAQFDQVFSTKVSGFQALYQATRKEPLRYLLIFSSVAARFGNAGQADYAMANEALNKIAQQAAVAHPDCRVLSFNWGPWDGGMVSPALKRVFAARGIDLIPLEQGARTMVREMAGKGGAVEIVVGSGLLPVQAEADRQESEIPAGGAAVPAAAAPAVPASDQMRMLFQRNIDPAAYPVLKVNGFGEKPCFPFSLMAEWLGHGALHANPGLFLLGMEDVRFDQCLIIREEGHLMHLLAGRTRREDGHFAVPVELRDGGEPEGRIHSRGVVLLGGSPPADAPAFQLPLDIRVKSYARSVEEVYEILLAKAPALQGIREIMACSEKRMAAKLHAAPSPDTWMAEPLRSRWIGDPLVMDGLFQMAEIWAAEHRRGVFVPRCMASYRQYCHGFPEDGVTAVFDISDSSASRLKGEITLLDRENRVVARVMGFEGSLVGDAATDAASPSRPEPVGGEIRRPAGGADSLSA